MNVNLKNPCYFFVTVMFEGSFCEPRTLSAWNVSVAHVLISNDPQFSPKLGFVRISEILNILCNYGFQHLPFYRLIHFITNPESEVKLIKTPGNHQRLKFITALSLNVQNVCQNCLKSPESELKLIKTLGNHLRLKCVMALS